MLVGHCRNPHLHVIQRHHGGLLPVLHPASEPAEPVRTGHHHRGNPGCLPIYCCRPPGQAARALPCDLRHPWMCTLWAGDSLPSAATTQVYYNPSSHYPTGARVATTANVVANTTANMGALPCTFFFFWLGSELSSERRAVLKSTAPSCAVLSFLGLGCSLRDSVVGIRQRHCLCQHHSCMKSKFLGNTT